MVCPALPSGKTSTRYSLPHFAENKIVKVEINDKGIFVDDTQVEETENTIEFTFENKKIEVPKTGVESKIKLFASAIILSLLGITYIIKRKQNKDK